MYRHTLEHIHTYIHSYGCMHMPTRVHILMQKYTHMHRNTLSHTHRQVGQSHPVPQPILFYNGSRDVAI